MDTSFTTTIMLPPKLIPEIRNITDIPLDIHVMVKNPECFLDKILPWCKGCYISVHAEATKQLREVVKQIRNAGAKPSVALNPGTSLCIMEEVVPYLDLILNGNAGEGIKQNVDIYMEQKIRRTREMFNKCGREDALIEVDGNISTENGILAKKNGADVFVLGTASIYGKEMGVVDCMNNFRRYVDQW